MRGVQAIVGLFPSSIESKSENKSQRNFYLEQRDDALAARFYYYFHIKRLRYDDCLLSMENEFYITSRVISERVLLKGDRLKDLVAKATTGKQLAKVYPHYKWD